MSRLTTPITVTPYEYRMDLVPAWRNNKYPIIIDKDNKDGTYQAHYDLDRMSTGQKILLSTS